LNLLKESKKMERVSKEHKPRQDILSQRLTDIFRERLYAHGRNVVTYMDIHNSIILRYHDDFDDLDILKTIHQVLYDEICMALRLHSVRSVTLKLPFVRPLLWEPYKLLRFCGFQKDVAWSILEYAEFVYIPTEERIIIACKTVFNSTSHLNDHFLSRERIWITNKDNNALLWGDELAEFILRAAKINAPLNFDYSF
jgi:hypothetical protein